MRTVPADLHDRVFTREEAHAHGVTDRMLQGDRFVRMHAGVYRLAGTEETLSVRIAAARAKVPSGLISHTTNLQWRGLDVGSGEVVHLATSRRCEVDLCGVTVHRYLHAIDAQILDGVPATTPARTFVDCGTVLGRRQLLEVGDWLVAQDLTTCADLAASCRRSHLDGVQRARSVVSLVRDGVASVMESTLRWHLHEAGLPEPEINADILDDRGVWLARGDLVLRRWKILIEYDGWQHERDAQQRQWDHLRREQLEAHGWRVVVITIADLQHPARVAQRIRQVLRQRGWRG